MGVDRVYQSATRSRTASVLQLHKSHGCCHVSSFPIYDWELITYFCSIPLPSRDVQLVHLKYNLHRDILIHDYSEFLLQVAEFQTTIRTEQLFND